MFDKLEDLLIRFDEVLNELGEPGVTDNPEHFQKLMNRHIERSKECCLQALAAQRAQQNL